MTTHITPEEHSNEVGGSTAARRIGCPDSRVLEKQVPKSRGSIYARAGTAMHELMAIILKKGLTPAEIDASLPFTFTGQDRDGDKVLEDWSYTIDAEEWASIGEPALQMFDDFVASIESQYDADFDMFIEVRGAFPGIPGGFGTSDVLWRCGKAAGCWDWKFGRAPVSAEGNKQLRFYMNTGIYEKPDFFNGVEDYILSICQPLVDDRAPSEEIVGIDDLIAFREELLEAMTGTGMAEGPWCKYADCALICPLKTGKTARLGAMMEDYTNSENSKIKGSDAPLVAFDIAEFLAEALELKDAAEEWSSKVAAMAQQMIDEKMLDIPGWKTVDKRSSGKNWLVSDETAKGMLAYRGLKVDDYAPRKLITVPAAIKKLKALDKELPEKAFEAKASFGTTLVREGDHRPSARTPAQRAATLAAAMAKLADINLNPEGN